MNDTKENMPHELADFENALGKYKSILDVIDKQHIGLLQQEEESKKFYRQIKVMVATLYQKGAELAALMEGLINKEIVGQFRYKLKSAYDLSDNYLHTSYDREQDVDFLEKIYWDVKPIIIREYLFQKQKIVKLNLNDNVDVDAKEYLKEAERALNAGAPRASVVMAGAALERILRVYSSLTYVRFC